MRCELLLVFLRPGTAFSDLASGWAAVNAQARRGEGLWDGPRPAVQLDPRDVIYLVTGALQHNGRPLPHSGTACLLRFSRPGFRLAGAPATPPTPEQLTNFFKLTQYSLLLEPEAVAELPSDLLQLTEEEAWQEMELFSGPDQPNPDAKLGWTLRREPRNSGGSASYWLIHEITWHDFRPRFHPGIGQEEWPRICG